MDVRNIKDYQEKMWFLGTDILEEEDLELMDSEVCTSFQRDEGAIYYVDFEEHDLYFHDLVMSGYSKKFLDIYNEAKRRKYNWIFFDRDITTEFGE